MWSVILTGIFTLLGVYIANRSNLKRYELEQRDRDLKLRLDKLEEFYVLFSKWSNICFSYYMYLLKLDNVSDSDRIERALANNKSAESDPIKMQMLVDIYFSDLNNHYEKVMEKRDHLSDFINNLPQNKNENSKLAKEVSVFSDICDQFQKKISEHSKLLLQSEAKQQSNFSIMITEFKKYISSLKDKHIKEDKDKSSK